MMAASAPVRLFLLLVGGTLELVLLSVVLLLVGGDCRWAAHDDRPERWDREVHGIIKIQS